MEIEQGVLKPLASVEEMDNDADIEEGEDKKLAEYFDEQFITTQNVNEFLNTMTNNLPDNRERTLARLNIARERLQSSSTVKSFEHDGLRKPLVD